MHDRGEAWRCQNGLIFGHFKSEFHDKLIKSEFHDLFQLWPMDNVHWTWWSMNTLVTCTHQNRWKSAHSIYIHWVACKLHNVCLIPSIGILTLGLGNDYRGDGGSQWVQSNGWWRTSQAEHYFPFLAKDLQNLAKDLEAKSGDNSLSPPPPVNHIYSQSQRFTHLSQILWPD